MRLRRKPVEQFVLGLFELRDLGHQLTPVAAHDLDVLAGLAQFPLGNRGLGDQGADARVVCLVGEMRELLVDDAELFVEVLETAAHLDEPPLDELASQGLLVYGAVLPGRSRSLARVVVTCRVVTRRVVMCRVAICSLTALSAFAGCGDGSSVSSTCDQPIREELDPASLTHVIDPEGANFKTNPPTSGPHVSGAVPTGLVDNALPGAVQVAILEAGDVIVQYRDLSGADLDEVKLFAGEQVVVAPSPDLPAPVIATAWTYKLTCDALDIDAIETFIADHAGAAVNP